MNYKRFLSTIERYYVSGDHNQYRLGQTHTPFLTQMVIECQGSVDLIKLQNAVTLASLANPGSRLVLKGHLGLSRWVDSGKTTAVVAIENFHWDGYSNDGADFLQRPLPARNGPTSEVILVKAKYAQYLVFRSHLGVMDNSGLQHFADDVFSILHEEAPLGENCQVSEMQLAKSLNKNSATVDFTNEVRAPTGVTKPVSTDKQSTWIRSTLAGKHEEILAKIAIEIARFSRLHGEDQVHFQLPMDMRKRMTNLYSTANLMGRILVNVSAQSNIKSLNKNIQSQRDQNNEAEVPPLFRYRFLSWLPQFVIRNSSNRLAETRRQRCFFRTSGEILNMGRVPTASYVGAGLVAQKVFFIPPDINTTALHVTLAEHPKGIDIVMRTPAYLDGGKLAQLMAFVVEGISHHKAAETLTRAQG